MEISDSFFSPVIKSLNISSNVGESLTASEINPSENSLVRISEMQSFVVLSTSAKCFLRDSFICVRTVQ